MVSCDGGYKTNITSLYKHHFKFVITYEHISKMNMSVKKQSFIITYFRLHSVFYLCRN